MKLGLPNHSIVWGGMAGLILGALVVLGFLTAAHLGQAHAAGSAADAEQAAEREAASAPSEPSKGGVSPAPVQPYPYTTWGMIERIASAQLDMGDEAGAFKMMALIPAGEKTRSPVYKTDREKAHNLLLIRVLHRHDPTGAEGKSRQAEDVAKLVDGGLPKTGHWHKVAGRLRQAEDVARLITEGLPRAGAWLKLAILVKGPDVSDPEAAKVYLKRAVAEASRPGANQAAKGRFWEAWEQIGGWLMLCWPLGLTTLGTLGAELARKMFESIAQGLGGAAAGRIGSRPVEAD